MQKTENVSIGRQSFICDKDAYSVIEKYLKEAAHNLKDDPDYEEILADIELAFAEHLREKTGTLVVNLTTAQQVIKLMGPVGEDKKTPGDQTEQPQSQTQNVFDKIAQKFSDASKQPFRKDAKHAILDGICAGIARAFSIDPLWVRLLFVALAFITNGGFVIVYIVLSFVMQSDEHANKKTASQVVSNAKAQAARSASAYERHLRSAVRLLLQTLRLTGAAISIVLLLVFATIWTILLIFIWSPNNRETIFGGLPVYALYVLHAAAGLVVLLPLFQLVLISLSPGLLKKTKSTIGITVVWMLSVIVLAGGSISATPQIKRHLEQQPPYTEHVLVETSNGKIQHVCVSLWGNCIKDQPTLKNQTRCGTDYSTYGQYQQVDFLTRNWNTLYVRLPYPATEQQYCNELTKIMNEKDATTQIIVSDKQLNDYAYQRPILMDFTLETGWKTIHYQKPSESIVEYNDSTGKDTPVNPSWYLEYMVR